jgi:hypothetical protein
MVDKKKTVRISLNPESHISGYHVTSSDASARRARLMRSVGGSTKAKPADLLRLQRRVSVLAVYFKQSRPIYASRARADAEYVRKARAKRVASLDAKKKKST